MKGLAIGAAAALLLAITLVAVLGSNGSVALAIAPALLVAALYAVWRLPLRYPVLIVTFLALTLENPSDVPAAGLWKSPLYTVGALLLAHLNVTFTGQHWMLFSGLDVVLVVLFGVALVRWARLRGAHQARGRSPLMLFVVVSLLGAAWMWIWGMAHANADVASSLWQMQRVVYLPLVVVLFHVAFRGPRDRVALGKVVVAAACTKAALAIYVRHTVTAPAGHPDGFSYATTHADSMLFAGALCLIAAVLIERFTPRRALIGGGVASLIVLGMIANERRLVWVELLAGLATVYAMTRRTRVKRSITRAAVIAAPALCLYVVAGWSSHAAIFDPIQTLRSVTDSAVDASTAWRDWENYNLFYTLRGNPILGTGYGHGYIEQVILPDVSQAYALYRFLPHNSILGLWVYGGVVGFTALWSILVVGVFLAARSARAARSSFDRVAAVAATVAIVVYLVHCYGDMGLGTWTSVFTVAPALAIAGHVAVATGAWPTPELRHEWIVKDLHLAPASARSHGRVSSEVVPFRPRDPGSAVTGSPRAARTGADRARGSDAWGRPLHRDSGSAS